MAIDLSALFRNNRPANDVQLNTQNIQNTVENSLDQQAVDSSVSDAAKVLQDMLAGDTFLGKVQGMKDNNVLLQLSNGSLLSARLSEKTQIQVGQNVTFLIENNTESNITLKPLTTNQQELMLIEKALDGANLSLNQNNVDAVKALLSNQMSLDAETIGNLVRNSLKFPEVSQDSIANLMKLEIPVTQENLTQYDAYHNFEHSILNQVNQLSGQLSDVAAHMMSDGNIQNGVDFMNHILTQLYNLDETVQTDNQSTNPSQQSIESMPVKELLNQNELTQLKDTIKENLPGQYQKLEAFIDQKDSANPPTVKDLIKELLHSINDEQQLQPQSKQSSIKEGIKNLFESKGMKMLLSKAFNETMKLTPANVAKEDAISNFYKRVRGNLESITEEAAKKAPDSEFTKNVNEMKQNIDFMNDLNKNISYIQMPIKFSNSETNGELYVFTNKKALQNKSDQVSALLHLDMDHLGPMDIYVKMSGQNVSTNFCLESEEMLDFVNEHIDELNQRLESLGYHTHFEMKVTEEQNETHVIDQFMPKAEKADAISTYLFDTKA